VGKSFEYWKNLYDQGIIEHHAIHLRFNHLKYALNHNLISNEEYNVHHLDITNQYNPSYTDYKPCSLINFCKALKTHNLSDNIKMNKPLITNKHSKELISQVQKYIVNTSENHQQTGALGNVHEYYLKKKQENNDVTEIPKKSRKKRKRKKKYNNNDCKSIEHSSTSNTLVTDNFKDECDEKMRNSTDTPKNTVKIFIRQTNNKNKIQITKKESLISNQRSARDMFSKMLKKIKNERIKMQC